MKPGGLRVDAEDGTLYLLLRRSERYKDAFAALTLDAAPANACGEWAGRVNDIPDDWFEVYTREWEG